MLLSLSLLAPTRLNRMVWLREKKQLEVTHANLVDIHVPNSYWLDAFLHVNTCLHKTISKEQQILECYDH